MLSPPTSARLVQLQKPSASPMQQQSSPTSTATDASLHSERHPPVDVPIETDVADRHPESAEGHQIRPVNVGLATDEDEKEASLDRCIDFLLLLRAWPFVVLLGG
jgi:hypothetical protein